MRIRLPASYIFSFLLLLLVMLELHETIHIVVGRLICGCWGTRDFNVWALCDGCEQTHSLYWLATLAGPLFSFGLMWFGMYLLYSVNIRARAFGFSLIFSNIPFGRISQVMMGSGDEMTVTRRLLKNDLSRPEMIWTCTIIVLILGLPPVIKAGLSLNNKRRWLYITGFLILPLVFLLGYVLTALNALLKNGFLSQNFVMNTALLITLHSSIALILLLFFFKYLFAIVRPEGKKIKS